MTAETVMTMTYQAMKVVLAMAGPLLLVTLVVGLVISIFQAATQINEMTLSFIPKLLAMCGVLVLLGPWLQRKAAARHSDGDDARRHTHRMLLLRAGMLLAGMYGGYFGAAQGVLMMGLMSVLLTDPLQSLNAVKNVLGTIVNAVAAVTFMVVAWDKIEWPVAGLLAVGGIAGGYLGARVGRRLPPPVLRGVIVLIGVVAITKMVFFS